MCPFPFVEGLFYCDLLVCARFGVGISENDGMRHWLLSVGQARVAVPTYIFFRRYFTGHNEQALRS